MDFYGVCILERAKAERHDEDYYLMMATHEYMTNHHH